MRRDPWEGSRALPRRLRASPTKADLRWGPRARRSAAPSTRLSLDHRRGRPRLPGRLRPGRRWRRARRRRRRRRASRRRTCTGRFCSRQPTRQPKVDSVRARARPALPGPGRRAAREPGSTLRPRPSWCRLRRRRRWLRQLRDQVPGQRRRRTRRPAARARGRCRNMGGQMLTVPPAGDRATAACSRSRPRPAWARRVQRRGSWGRCPA